MSEFTPVLRRLIINRGGEGSGFFGHAGRPGEVGGSAPSGEGGKVAEPAPLEYHGLTKDSPLVRSLANERFAEAKQREPQLSDMVESIAATTGGTLAGFDFRLKREDSVARKIISDAIEKDISPEQAAADMTDLNRYTIVYNREDIVPRVIEAENRLADEGFQKYDDKWRNYFAQSSSPDEYNAVYHGYNTVWLDPETNTRFEVQFHTPETYAAKDQVHLVYERYRTLPASHPERQSLWSQMSSMWADYTPPMMFDRLPGLCVGCPT